MRLRLPPMFLKLVRDLWGIRSQAAAIGLVIGSGIGLFFGMQATFDSLFHTRDTFYRENRFGDIFASAKRAPDRLLTNIREIPGVSVAQSRVVVDVTLDVPGMAAPAKGRLISVPAEGRPKLNDVTLVRGRWIDSRRPDEAVVSEAFARAHGFQLGDSVAAVINGRRRDLQIVGIGQSPEFVYLIGGNDLFPDDKRFGVFWVARRPLATAFNMEGGFNDVSLALAPGASEPQVLAQLDALLEPFGGFGAIARNDQISNWYLENELIQLSNMGRSVPTLFLLVAVFLLNVVLTRVIAVQRQQIAALKALGRTNFEIGLHYASWAISIGLFGALFGILAGIWLAQTMLEMYKTYFAFPQLYYDPAVRHLWSALALALGGALLGAFNAVRSAVSLPPAQAMRPPTPPNFRRSWFAARWLDPTTKIILRNIVRVPARTGLSVVGIATAVAIMLVGTSMTDAMEELATVQFDQVQRQDVTVTFAEPVSTAAFFELQRMPGVHSVEPMRSVPVVLRAGVRSKQTALLGLTQDPRLMRAVDDARRAHQMPVDGLMLSQALARQLEVSAGDRLIAEVREGRRPHLDLKVAKVIDDYMGTSAYIEISTLHRVMQEAGTLSGALLEIDSSVESVLYRKLKDAPRVAGVALRQAALDNFETFLKDNMSSMMGINLLFAAIIAFGVVYNTARISLSERARDLASLRVLGFRKREISYILLGEQALLVLISLPIGLLLGRWLLRGLVNMMTTELYRMPFVLQSQSQVIAAMTVVVAAAASALVVRRRLDQLDLIEVLKTRE